MTTPLLRLGTRGSRLALVQAGLVRDALAAAMPALSAPAAIEIVAIKTTGDAIQDRPLSEAGGKGLFVKEIEEALLARRIDAAVHSMKDMPTAQPPGLAISAFLPREDARDVLIAGGVQRIADLRQGAVVGTSALRRRAQLLHRRPDLQVVDLRGNVETRLAKRAAGDVEATLLALAGLRRLGMAHVGTPVPEQEMLPAVGQGAVCIECREDDARTRGLLAAVDHTPTATCVTAEHAMLAVLDGSCRTPIAGHAILTDDGSIFLRGLIVKPDGSQAIATERRGAASDAEALGRDAGHELKRRGGPGFLST
ncbi:MAG: hydroxymethylbilane synthase [Reyranella sp.]|uniref:hydroxymethylbilane synthase n=1 Tax=Reyranella sp. TaxID=1929291 RepID=UPI00272FC455|nr:hydroxymethylbilane synthase [Reyranella sp.]MDP1967274.1 hydroxymethylbilane synthase [Reyranella sp.]MDP2373575.1 hydroxymethylbilane synthase [Reyranella sp.]